MKNLGNLLNSLLTKAGLDVNKEDVKNLLSNADITRITIPDEMSDALENNLMTLDSAKANSNLKSHFFAQAYDGLDKELEKAYTDNAISDDLKSKLLAEKSSTKRAILFAKEIQELEKQKASANSGADKKDLQDKINALEKEKADLANSHKSDLENIKSQHEGEMTGMLVRNQLSGLNYAMGELPAEVKIETARNLLQSELQKKELKIVNNNGVLKLVKNDGTDYYEQNKLINFTDFVGGVMASNKMLKTSDPGGGSGGGATDPKTTVVKTNNDVRVNNGAVGELEAQLAALQGN